MIAKACSIPTEVVEDDRSVGATRLGFLAGGSATPSAQCYMIALSSHRETLWIMWRLILHTHYVLGRGGLDHGDQHGSYPPRSLDLNCTDCID